MEKEGRMGKRDRVMAGEYSPVGLCFAGKGGEKRGGEEKGGYWD